MKTAYFFFGLFLFPLLFLSSCLKEGKETILVHDPQIIPFITDERWSPELRELFGEEHVNFGDIPPQLDCEFVSNHQYAATNLPYGESPSIGSMTPVVHYHKFDNQYLQICQYHSMNSGENVQHVIDTAYVTGHDNKFTVYYLETLSTGGTPTLAVIISGELSDKGVVNYRYGYQIINYADEEIPTNVYPLNAIFVFQDPDGLSEYVQWYQ